MKRTSRKSSRKGIYSQRGFGLAEVLVAIAILSIAMIGFINFFGALDMGHIREATSTQNIQKARFLERAIWLNYKIKNGLQDPKSPLGFNSNCEVNFNSITQLGFSENTVCTQDVALQIKASIQPISNLGTCTAQQSNTNDTVTITNCDGDYSSLGQVAEAINQIEDKERIDLLFSSADSIIICQLDGNGSPANLVGGLMQLKLKNNCILPAPSTIYLPKNLIVLSSHLGPKPIYKKIFY